MCSINRPGQVRAFEQTVDLGNTIFIVSSKSGSTLEPHIFCVFFHRLSNLGRGQAGRFIAITDRVEAGTGRRKDKSFRHFFTASPA